jgi:hypothetical protein
LLTLFVVPTAYLMLARDRSRVADQDHVSAVHQPAE